MFSVKRERFRFLALLLHFLFRQEVYLTKNESKMRHLYKADLWSVLILSLFTIIFSQPMMAAAPNSVQEYVKLYADLAIEEMEKHQIPASITLAQGILESRYGNSDLVTKANNHFGIKCHTWTGPVVYLDDDTVGECFRAYSSATESYEDHSMFLQRKRYQLLFDYKITDYKKWAKGLSHAGYATNPKYADQLIDIIERYSLNEFDRLEPMMASVAKDAPKRTSNPRKIRQETKKPQPRGRIKKGDIFFFNRIKSIVVSREASLQQIAMTYDISVSKLSKYNDLGEDAVVPANSRIYLQAKRTRATYGKDVHRINKGENMAWISHEYGVKMDCLYKRNKMVEGQEPADGELVQLREKTYSRPQLKEPDTFDMYQDWTVAARRKTGVWDFPTTTDPGNTSLTLSADSGDDLLSYDRPNRPSLNGSSRTSGGVKRKVVSKKRSFSFDGETDLSDDQVNKLESDYGVDTGSKSSRKLRKQNRKSTQRVTKEWSEQDNSTLGEVVNAHPEDSRLNNRGGAFTSSNNGRIVREESASSNTRVVSKPPTSSRLESTATVFDEPVSTYSSGATEDKMPEGIRMIDVGGEVRYDEPITSGSNETYNASSSTRASTASTSTRRVIESSTLEREDNTRVNPPAADSDFGGARFVYRVKKGDTLYSLSKKLETTVVAIKKANGLVDNIISIGQELVIPQ